MHNTVSTLFVERLDDSLPESPVGPSANIREDENAKAWVKGRGQQTAPSAKSATEHAKNQVLRTDLYERVREVETSTLRVVGRRRSISTLHYNLKNF